MQDWKLFKSVAGKKLRWLDSNARHNVTPVGSNHLESHGVFLEIQGADGVRRKLHTMDYMRAKRLRYAYDHNTLGALTLEVVPASVGGTKFKTLSAKVGDKLIPVFRIGGVIGVVNSFRDKCIETLNSKRTIRTLDMAVHAMANKLGVTPAEMVGKKPSSLAEFKEKGYGAQFYKCSGPVATAYRQNVARINSK